MIKSVTNEWQTCKKFKKLPPRPIISLPLASEFQETVAMDLKFYEDHIILHLIGVCTQQKQRNSGNDNLLPMDISIGLIRQNFS